jgi:hypothetical protein
MRIGPMAGTTPRESGQPRRARPIPGDLLRAASRRLCVVGLLGAVLWTVGTILVHLVEAPDMQQVAKARAMGSYELGELFGSGGMGEVYRAELLEGLDLETLVREHGPVPASRTIHILRAACESLEEAHARGLVHRDIKPANIHVVIEIITKHVVEAPVPPSKRSGREVPEALERLVLECLAKKPSGRPADAATLARALAAIDVEPWSEEQAKRWWEENRREPPS